jgi:hypothetical protein
LARKLLPGRSVGEAHLVDGLILLAQDLVRKMQQQEGWVLLVRSLWRQDLNNGKCVSRYVNENWVIFKLSVTTSHLGAP